MSGTAIGVFECRGMVALAAALDAMGKAANVRLHGRHGIGSGWLTLVIDGTTADVQTAIDAARSAAAPLGDVITHAVLPRPEVRALASMPHARQELGSAVATGEALGFLETRGVVPLSVGADAMVKAADVRLRGWTFIGGALVHAVIDGGVGDVASALTAGRDAAACHTEAVDHLLLEQPEGDVLHLLPPPVVGAERSLGALGVVETTGYVGAVHAADAMVKEAQVDILRLTIGSGGRVATVACGPLDSVRTAVNHAAQRLPAVAELNGQALISNPDPQVVAAFAAPAPGPPRPPSSGDALGLLETRTTVGLVSAVDAMLKHAQVIYEGRHKVGYFLTAAVIRGELGAVADALETGARTAQRHGELLARHLIPLPYTEVTDRLPHA